MEAMLSLPAGLGPTGARTTGVEEHPTNNDAKPATRSIKTLFIILHYFHQPNEMKPFCGSSLKGLSKSLPSGTPGAMAAQGREDSSFRAK
jgi:hypothetical protein